MGAARSERRDRDPSETVTVRCPAYKHQSASGRARFHASRLSKVRRRRCVQVALRRARAVKNAYPGGNGRSCAGRLSYVTRQREEADGASGLEGWRVEWKRGSQPLARLKPVQPSREGGLRVIWSWRQRQLVQTSFKLQYFSPQES